MINRNYRQIFITLLTVLPGFLLPRLDAAVTIAPTTYTLAPGQPLTLNVSGAVSSGVKWTLSPALGTLTSGTSSAVYTAPSAYPSTHTVKVIATTVATPVTVVTAVITLIPAVTVVVTPAAPVVASGSHQTFLALVTGSTNKSVTWSASLGTISAAGVYTAPTVTAPTTDTVIATSNVNRSSTGRTSIKLDPLGFSFTTQANGLASLVFNGINYNYLYSEGLVTSVTTATANGLATVNPVCTGSFTPTTVSKHCPTVGADSVDVSVTFSTPPAAAGTSTAPGTNYGTIQADIQITNNSATDTIAQAMVSILGIAMTQYNAASSKAVGISGSNPIVYVNYGTGQWIMWANTVSPTIGMNQACGWSYACKNQPLISDIAPGQTVNASFSLRITDDLTSPMANLAPEAYTAYRAVYPSVVNWPDRRPIINWFIADTAHQSALNPRGYLWDPALDVSNVPNFQALVMAQAQNLLTEIQSRPVQPQGIIIWDLEGEEFIQATTYIGDPRVFSQGYAAEMDATADGLFALFQNAGLKVGMTLRPQYLQWGAALPPSCNYNANNNYKDYFINVNAPFLQKFYSCYDPAGLLWSLIPKGNGGQTFYTAQQTAQVTALLMAKVAYAHARWGATLYYVDTSVSVGGAPLDQSIFRALELAYPDCLFIPEESYDATMGVAMPYTDPNVSNLAKFAPASSRYFYPTGADAVNLTNCQGACWAANVGNFEIGQKIGDIPIYAMPNISMPQLTTIESMILTARSQAGSITVTDSSSGAQYSFQGSPSTVYQYPVKMRVYFADTAADLPTSTTYCESGGWLGTNTCTLNLAGLTAAQVQYYDFNDQLVLTEAAGPL